jgi:hypothetical protein
MTEETNVFCSECNHEALAHLTQDDLLPEQCGVGGCPCQNSREIVFSLSLASERAARILAEGRVNRMREFLKIGYRPNCGCASCLEVEDFLKEIQ